MGIVSTLISFAMELSTIFATHKDKPNEMIEPITDAIINALGFVSRQQAQRWAHQIIAPYLVARDF